MNTVFFTLLNASNPVKALLGSNPLRVFPAGRAPEETQRPYAVYSIYNGNPENYLNQAPDIDNNGIQVSIYADTYAEMAGCFTAVRDALQNDAHMISYTTPDQDADTNLFSCRMEFDFWDDR